MKSAIAIAAVLVTVASLGATLPVAAQDTTPPTPPSATTPAPDQPHWPHMLRDRGNGPRMGFGRGMGPGGNFGRGGLVALACSDKGPEALEIALVRLHYRLDLTADQEKLFDAFRTKALTAETGFADTCKAARPDAATGKPNLLDRLKSGLAVDQARLTAINTVLPDFEAFYASLTDQQKANLLPHRFGPGGDRFHRWGNHDRGGMGRPSSDQS